MYDWAIVVTLFDGMITGILRAGVDRMAFIVITGPS